MTIAAQIDSWFAQCREGLVSLLSDLIACETVNPPGNEQIAADVVTAFFDRCEIPWESHAAKKGRTNVIGRIGGDGRGLLTAGHLDTVPAGDGWTLPPFEATVRDGRVYGRGAMDNKGPTAAMLLAAQCLNTCCELDGHWLIAAVADEECGSVLGLDYLLDNEFVKPDLAIIPDIGGNMRQIDVAEKGLLQFEIVAHGSQAHASTPEKGMNAVWNLITVLQRFRERGLPPAEHPLLSPATYNLGEIRGGVAYNVVPARAVAKIDIRWLPGQSADDILNRVREVLAEVEKEIPSSRFDLEESMRMPPSEVPPDHELVTTLRKRTQEVIGEEPELIGIGGVTVAKPLNLRGIPAVGWAVGDAGIAHMRDEYIEIEELLTFGRILARVAADLLGARDRGTH